MNIRRDLFLEKLTSLEILFILLHFPLVDSYQNILPLCVILNSVDSFFLISYFILHLVRSL